MVAMRPKSWQLPLLWTEILTVMPLCITRQGFTVDCTCNSKPYFKNADKRVRVDFFFLFPKTKVTIQLGLCWFWVCSFQHIFSQSAYIMSIQLNAPQLQGVLILLETKQKNPGDSNVETQFFNEALEYLLSSSVTHWWCTNSTLPIARESLWLFSLPDHHPIVQYKKKLDNQLKTCTYCVQAYQTSKLFVKQR